MTPSQSGRPRLRVLFVLLSLVILSGGIYLACSRGRASAAVGELPPSIIKGSQLLLVLQGREGVAVESFEVQEVRASWVRAKAVKTTTWKEGVEVWINLSAIDQLVVDPPKSQGNP